MTELENQLLLAFEELEKEHEKRHQDFVTAYNGLVKMFDTTSLENKKLSQSVSSLTEQVQSLNSQLQRLEKHNNMSK
ncbi:mobilization protein [Vibrio ichthyoenteri ATCC 700023]|uniref:Mobilization protein n=1 Tax=Vibrio ichthyoenteri ATCC 700023 TaxID=870968 RepID=F9S039_9VIBR|nr:mobilization protein [Vibrio ichthyoenteri ATCC 700023]